MIDDIYMNDYCPYCGTVKNEIKSFLVGVLVGLVCSGALIGVTEIARQLLL